MKATAETYAPRRKRSVTEAIVGGALLGIHQNIVGLAEFFELFFGMRVVRIFMRMKLHGELAVSALDFVVGGIAPGAQHFVVVAFLRSSHVPVCVGDVRDC